jgi:hypothetical protein
LNKKIGVRPLSFLLIIRVLEENKNHSTSFDTDSRGIIDIPGMGFKDIYNQMAPGHMRIQQQAHYGYFNVERR